MKKWTLGLLAGFLAGTVSCVQDNGNYSYTDVNEVLAELPVEYERVYLEEQDISVHIAPTLTQTLAADNSNLSFVWKYSRLSASAARNQSEVLSTEPSVDLFIDAANPRYDNHYYWLEITDHSTGLVYPFHTSVKVIKPFVNTWAVLHADGSGLARLGAIEYLEDTEPAARIDVFADFGYPALTGRPVAMGYDNIQKAVRHETTTPLVYNTFYLITDNPHESGVYAPWKTFRPYVDSIFVPQMVEHYSPATFDVADISPAYKTNAAGSVIINRGRLFQGRMGLKWYEAKIAPGVTGEVYIEQSLRVGGITLLYDGAGKRFLWYNNAGNADAPNAPPLYSFTPEYFHAHENQAEILALDRPVNGELSLKDIAHRVLYIGAGHQDGGTYLYVRSFAIANGEGGKTYLYLFPNTRTIQATTNSSVEEIKVIDTPEGLDEHSRFASSTAYTNLVFYSSGNRVYRLDFNTGSATLVYEHTGAGTIAALRMAKQESALSTSQTYDTRAYGFDALGRSLGVAVNNGSEGELVVLHLNEAGMYTSRSVFDGFGAITDICFLCDIVR